MSSLELRTVFWITFVLLAAMAAGPGPVLAQEPLTLAEAMARARADTPAARALALAEDEAAARVRQARAGYLPRIDLATGVQRGDAPVFAFSSLLSQRRFTAADFDVGRLNEPAALTNLRTALTVEQPVFDAGQARLAVEESAIRQQLTNVRRADGTGDLAMRAAETFVRVLQLEAAERAATAAVTASESDLARARARRETGLVTEADVLSVEVHLADMRQRQIGAAGELTVARLHLNELIGRPLDAPLVLARPTPDVQTPDAAAIVAEALAGRPERREAALQVRLAENAQHAARAAFLPTVAAQASWDLNGRTWPDQRSSWLVGAQVTMNVFRGFADSARLAAARSAAAAASADAERVARAVEVDVRGAMTRLETARAREAAGRATVAQARESQRIIRDRYENGLATIADVLGAAHAVLAAESLATAAEAEVILQGVALERAAGRL